MNKKIIEIKKRLSKTTPGKWSWKLSPDIEDVEQLQTDVGLENLKK